MTLWDLITTVASIFTFLTFFSAWWLVKSEQS